MLSDKVATLIYLKDQKVAEVLKEILLAHNPKYSITIADCFEVFFELINLENFAFIILDYELEKFTALHIIEKLRKTKKFSKSIIAIYASQELNLQIEEFSKFSLNLIIDSSLKLSQFEVQLNNAFKKLTSKIIPPEFNVLILDDSPEIVDILSEYLSELGHKKFTTCDSIKSARKLITAQEFDIFLLDWNLVDGTCIELIEQIRQDTRRMRSVNALIMVITGRNDVEDIMTLLKYKVVDHIIKPFDDKEFNEKLEFALGRHLSQK